MKKLMFLAIAVVVVAAACGSSSKPKSTPAPSGNSPTSAAAVTPATGNPPTAEKLTESGSSLLFPYLQELVSPLAAAYSNIKLQPAAGGSGKGISDAIAGNVTMGGSDAYLSAAQVKQTPGLVNIPVAVSSQAVDYNLKGVTTPLRLSGNVIALIYQGKITKWNDPQITALNPGVTIPATTIVPIHRSDSSGDTFIFTSFLTATNTAWNNGPNLGTTVTWPSVPGELTANGNPGMVQTCSATPGCIAYVGISAQSKASQGGLGEAMLQDKNGGWTTPTSADVLSAVDNSISNVPASLAASLIYAPGANSYPIVNFEYLVLKQQQSDPNLAGAIRTFLSWTISTSGGSQPSLLAKENFEALPTAILPKVNAAIAAIK